MDLLPVLSHSELHFIIHYAKFYCKLAGKTQNLNLKYENANTVQPSYHGISYRYKSLNYEVSIGLSIFLLDKKNELPNRGQKTTRLQNRICFAEPVLLLIAAKISFLGQSYAGNLNYCLKLKF